MIKRDGRIRGGDNARKEDESVTGIMVLLAYIVIRGVIFGLICENLASTKGYATALPGDFSWA